MREDNQRVGPGAACSIADSHLSPARVVNYEEVLGSWCNILVHMLRSRGIPDFTRELPVPYRIKCLDRTHTNRKWTPHEWIVFRSVRRTLF
jgi:hypothetical protein